MPQADKDRYAILAWSPEDVQTLRPFWSIERCRRQLEANQKHICDRLTEVGWDVIGVLIDAAGDAYVIHSASENVFWSNEDGFGAFQSSTIFDDEEQKILRLPVAAAQDACWMKLADAQQSYGPHPDDPDALPDHVADLSDRHEESTAQRLCSDLLHATHVSLSDSVGFVEIRFRNDGALTVAANNDGEYHGEFVSTEAAFSYQRAADLKSVTMAELCEAQPMGEDGYLLRDGREVCFPPKRIIAVFQPQAWVNDNAMLIDHPHEVDVTHEVLALDLDEIIKMNDDQPESDALVDVDKLGHSGPFYVQVTDAITSFFAVDELDQITDAMLSAARTRCN